MYRDAIKFVQRELERSGPVDGIIGPKTMKAVQDFLHREELEGKWVGWANYNQVVLAAQVIMGLSGINPGRLDGYWGPRTDTAHEEWEEFAATGRILRNFRDDEDYKDDAHVFPMQRERDLIEFYGEPGDSSKQRFITLPYEMRLAWDTDQRIRRVRCHELVAKSLQEALEDVLDIYGYQEISDLGLDLFGGILSVRKKRGGTTWSMHAWGAAIDIDPEHNKLRWGRDKARMAKPDYDEWWQVWEDLGWTSLGRARDRDFMHIQAVRLK